LQLSEIRCAAKDIAGMGRVVLARRERPIIIE
jgi:hypothetical protein